MDGEKFRRLFQEMRDEGIKILRVEGIPEERVCLHLSLDLRYVRQYHEVAVEITWEQAMDADPVLLAKKFHPQHDALYGYSLEDKGTPVELMNMRLTAAGVTEKPNLTSEALAGGDPSPAFKGKRRVYVPGEKRFQNADVFDGMKLKFGNRIEGPAILEQVNTTTFVTPEFKVIVDRFGTYTLYVPEKEQEMLGRVLG
jgi:N-methylhydantoinase A